MRRIDFDTWEEIFLTITRNKTRSVLTAFGIFWGIFMLVALMGGARGMQDMLSRQFQGFATNSGFMASNNTSKAYKGFQQGRWWSMENQDVERLRNSVPGLDIVTATIAQWGVNIVYEQYSISGTLKGLYPEYDRIEEPLIRIGRSLNETDIRDRRKVCVIGKRIYETLFPKKDDPCGKFIEINGIYYRVVGVNEATGNMSVNGQSETSVVIPFSTMQQNYNRGNRIDMLGYTAKKGYSISQVEKDVERIVKQAHAIHPDDEQAGKRGSHVQHDGQPVYGYPCSGMARGTGYTACRCHRGEQHHDDHREGTYHRNRHPPCHRSTPQRHPATDSAGKHGAYHPSGHGRYLVCRLPARCRRKGNVGTGTAGTLPHQLLASHRSLRPAHRAGTAGGTDSCLPRHGDKTDRSHTRRIINLTIEPLK